MKHENPHTVVALLLKHPTNKISHYFCRPSRINPINIHGISSWGSPEKLNERFGSVDIQKNAGNVKLQAFGKTQGASCCGTGEYPVFSRSFCATVCGMIPNLPNYSFNINKIVRSLTASFCGFWHNLAKHYYCIRIYHHKISPTSWLSTFDILQQETGKSWKSTLPRNKPYVEQSTFSGHLESNPCSCPVQLSGKLQRPKSPSCQLNNPENHWRSSHLKEKLPSPWPIPPELPKFKSSKKLHQDMKCTNQKHRSSRC